MATVIDTIQSFLGLHGLLVPATVSPEMDNITKDFTAEQETMLAEPGKSNMNSMFTTLELHHAVGASLIDTTLQSILMEASKSIMEGTNAEYQRLMNSFDHGLDHDTLKPSHVKWSTYGHAQKMQVFMTYAFGRLSGLGNLTWHESDIGGGLIVINSSISIEVSSYMCSFHKCKVQVGNLAKTIYYNHLPKNWTIRAYQPGSEDTVRALAAWLKESKVMSGYLFQKIASGDQITEANSPMSSEQFLELFQNNLLNVDIDPTPYDTHLFWRGGVLVLACQEVLVTLENLQVGRMECGIYEHDNCKAPDPKTSTATSTEAPALPDSRRGGTPLELRTTAVWTAVAPPLA
ncbi:uncharacterized protein F5147DRAFT_651604 [Suillus discolor]|uniref:Uncharacterized protein n=1 Tax=Suillus discolor TaxID=1912936 RepID=A0A9P7JVL8_9AGAM|nr:uncharacterized protein F5147DRAFT_651604 [Suillus discolor]KAG2110898.1 hypothetical protein F5147DRAFT_651604 [Suillus discolor]